MKIYLDIPKDTVINNIYDLLLWGYSHGTKYTFTLSSFAKTYTKKDCIELQCNYARRTFDDLLHICKTYFPKTTPKEVAKTLKQLHTDIWLEPAWCGDIKCTVWMVYLNGPFELNSPGNEDNKGIGKYSFNDVMELITEP